MNKEEIEIGKWYIVKSYGFSTCIKGKAVDVVGNSVVLKFYWGAFWRTKQVVDISRLLGESKRPSLFSNM